MLWLLDVSKVAAAVEIVKVDKEKGYINILFHNKGMNMIGLQRIFNRSVMTALSSNWRGLLFDIHI